MLFFEVSHALNSRARSPRAPKFGGQPAYALWPDNTEQPPNFAWVTTLVTRWWGGGNYLQGPSLPVGRASRDQNSYNSTTDVHNVCHRPMLTSGLLAVDNLHVYYFNKQRHLTGAVNAIPGVSRVAFTLETPGRTDVSCIWSTGGVRMTGAWHIRRAISWIRNDIYT